MSKSAKRFWRLCNFSIFKMAAGGRPPSWTCGAHFALHADTVVNHLSRLYDCVTERLKVEHTAKKGQQYGRAYSASGAGNSCTRCSESCFQ